MKKKGNTWVVLVWYVMFFFFLLWWFVIAMSWLGHGLGPLDWALKRHGGVGLARARSGRYGCDKNIYLVNGVGLGYGWRGEFRDKETRLKPDPLSFLDLERYYSWEKKLFEIYRNYWISVLCFHSLQ